MIGYPYIQQLFYAVLSKSKVLHGNFFVCPKWGSEMSNPNIDDAVPIGKLTGYKYPAAMLMPPPKRGNFQYGGDSKGSGTSLYDVYSIQMLFVTPAKASGANQPLQPNSIGQSSHTILDTWHDMDRVAQNFLIVLRSTLQSLGGSVQISDAADAVPHIRVASDLGNDAVSGVMLSFKLLIFSGCTVEDYPSDYRTTVVAPAYTDIHPIHSM